MQEQKGATETELEEAWGKAWSCSDKPPGKYIGPLTQGKKIYHFYKQGQEYFYETDFDRETRVKEKEKRRSRFEKRQGG